jgi:hypothetical protein
VTNSSTSLSVSKEEVNSGLSDDGVHLQCRVDPMKQFSTMGEIPSSSFIQSDTRSYAVSQALSVRFWVSEFPSSRPSDSAGSSQRG